MTKRDRKKNGNVVLFPDLEKRLLIKGVENLKEKNYRQAIRLLEEASQLDLDNEEINVGLVLAYFEAGFFREARDLAKEMLNRGIGEYFQTIDLYLMILIQLHEYEELITTIQVLIEENEIPDEKRDHLLHMLQFSKKMVDENQEKEANHFEKAKDQIVIDHLFRHDDRDKQLFLISKLSHLNIRPYIEEIQTFLKSEEASPFLKTLVLNILKEQEYDKEIQIMKNGQGMSIIPKEIMDVKNQPLLNAILSELQSHLEQNDPILFQNTKELIERQHLMIYPFSWDPANAKLWAAAYQTVSNEYLGFEHMFEAVCEEYDVLEKDVLIAQSFIKKIEEISYPIF